MKKSLLFWNSSLFSVFWKCSNWSKLVWNCLNLFENVQNLLYFEPQGFPFLELFWKHTAPKKEIKGSQGFLLRLHRSDFLRVQQKIIPPVHRAAEIWAMANWAKYFWICSLLFWSSVLSIQFENVFWVLATFI